MTVSQPPTGGFAALGPFFAIDLMAPDEAPEPQWAPMRELVEIPGRLAARVHAVRTALANGAGLAVDDIEWRVAASTAQFGLVARLIAPAVATHAWGSPVLDLGLDALWWQDRLGTPFPLAGRLRHTANVVIAATAIEAITEAIAAEFSVARRVLWGNVGSAANSAAQLLADVRPDLAERARWAADLFLADPHVDGGRLHSAPSFRRRSCCLIYRTSGSRADVCGDCVLTAAP